MNNLWIFGDSFSSTCFPHERSDNMKNYLNSIDSVDIKSWSELLSKKLNYELKNFAKGGNSNYQIFQDFCDQSHLIKENDIVVIGWGLIQKFRISQNNKFINISPGNNSPHGTISKFTIDTMLENRSKFLERKGKSRIDRWAFEVYGWETAIQVLSKNKKFKVFFWSTEEPRLIYNESDECKSKKNYLCKESKKPLMIHLKELGCLTISDETNNLIGDSHFGIKGHHLQSEIFYKEITN
jgi:hypothetical protein